MCASYIGPALALFFLLPRILVSFSHQSLSFSDEFELERKDLHFSIRGGCQLLDSSRCRKRREVSRIALVVLQCCPACHLIHPKRPQGLERSMGLSCMIHASHSSPYTHARLARRDEGVTNYVPCSSVFWCLGRRLHQIPLVCPSVHVVDLLCARQTSVSATVPICGF